MAAFGPCLAELPWCTPERALRALSPPAQHGVRQAEQLLADGWLNDPAESLIQAMRLIGRGVVIVHSGARGKWPSWVIHDYRGKPSFKASDIFGNENADFGKARLYELDGSDPFAHRPVNLSTLARSLDNVRPLFELLAGCDLYHQLRTVLYDEQPSLIGYFGLYLPEHERSFTLEEHAALHAVTPALTAWIHTAKAIGVQPLPETGLTAALDANERPCFLVRDDGAIIFANRSARQAPLHADRRQKIRRLMRSAPRLPLGAASLRLIVLREAQKPREHLSIASLPGSLARVACELAKGSSDKDIARDLDMPLATVRTYTQRVLSRLGCSSRRELIQRSCWDLDPED